MAGAVAFARAATVAVAVAGARAATVAVAVAFEVVVAFDAAFDVDPR